MTGPLPSAQNVPRFVTWHWRKKPRALPQMWFTAEAMESIGMPVEDANPSQVAEIVEQTFGCRVTWHQSGFFTCQWGSGGETAPADGGDGQGVAIPSTRRSVQLVFVPWLPLDPSDARPGDLGVAGIENTDTELPEDEDQAVPILAERIAWLAESLGDGIGPASRWSTVGAAFADVVSRRSTIKGVKGCPLPGEVLAAQSDLDPDLHEGKRPHKARGEYVKVETDQRAAYLASVTKLSFGYGEPTRVDHPDPDVFNTQNPPFALWRLTTPAGGDIDGLSKRLPLPHGYMDWEEPRTFWATTPAVRHLISPVDNGGAGLSPAELAIDAAWVWPHQSRQLLRSWGEEIRLLLKEAITEGRTDRENMLKAMYKAYLGRMKSPKWSPQQYHHHQPAWYAAIQADTRARAMTFAVRIAQTHGLYPVAADVDAWMYWVAPDVDITVLAEPEEHNGRYRIKAVEYPPGTKGASDKGETVVRKIRQRRPPPEEPTPPPAPATPGEEPGRRRGAAAAMWALAQRKLRELRGRRWEAATERQRAAEADRRAREELARRIERQTGRRPSERTLRRHARAGTVPRGVDEQRLARQAAVDAEGGITKFARRYGLSRSAAARWRDRGGPPPAVPESLRFFVALVATLVSKGERYKTDQVWTTEITVDGASVAGVVEAARTGDFSGVKDFVGALAADQFPWTGAADRIFEVSEVLDISVVQ